MRTRLPHSITQRLRSAGVQAGVAAIALLTVVGALVVWLTVVNHRIDQDRHRDNMFLAAGRQSAILLTTMDHDSVDSDVQRVLDSSVGGFHDQFQQQLGPFVDVIKQLKSRTSGTVTEAAVESVAGDTAQVLVAVTVRTTTAAVPEEDSKPWRMRIGLRKVGGVAKINKVEFVP